MKKAFAILVLNLIVLACYSQKFAIADYRDNILYIGIPNSISIAVENCSCKLLSIKANGGGPTIVEKEPCEYEIMVTAPGDVAIEIEKNTPKGKKTIGMCRYRAHFIPNPVAKVGGKKQGVILKNVLCAQQGVLADFEGFDFDARSVIKGFSIIIMHHDKAIYSKTIIGARFDDEIKQHFQLLEDADVVVFANIMAKLPDGRIVNLQPIQLTTKG